MKKTPVVKRPFDWTKKNRTLFLKWWDSLAVDAQAAVDEIWPKKRTPKKGRDPCK